MLSTDLLNLLAQANASPSGLNATVLRGPRPEAGNSVQVSVAVEKTALRVTSVRPMACTDPDGSVLQVELPLRPTRSGPERQRLVARS